MKKDYGDFIANKVYEFRVLKKMSQKDLADKIGVSKQTIFVMEKGNYVPSLLLAFRIAEYFNVSVDYILGKSEIRNPYESHARIKDSIEDDPELLEFWEVLKEREDLQLMFKQTKQMSPKDIRQIIKIIKAIEDEEDAEN